LIKNINQAFEYVQVSVGYKKLLCGSIFRRPLFQN
jgi:hypothetical protein